MQFHDKKENWSSIEEGEKKCFLLTNGLGGYSSLSLIGSASRGDHALFMAAHKAPNVRYHYVSNVLETMTIDGTKHLIFSQRMMEGSDFQGYTCLDSFTFAHYPTWKYRIGDVTLYKKLIMLQGENTVALRYEIEAATPHTISLQITPLLRFTPKNTDFTNFQGNVDKQQEHLFTVFGNDSEMNIITNGLLSTQEPRNFGPMYFSQDERDGRTAYGYACINHSFTFPLYSEQKESQNNNNAAHIVCPFADIIFSTRNYTYHENLFPSFLNTQLAYQDNLIAQSGLRTDLGKQLALSADAYVVNRDSTNGKSIIAGYPFFEDWGRDTMIALPGITMVTKRFADCKSILRTFAKYEVEGLLPNLFPEGDAKPMYNSADAPLLFVNAVYEYLQFSNDMEFLPEIWPVLQDIIFYYKKGTKYHIHMDTDGLIMAGADKEQLTWMDVRVGDFLPTPRHGKPVEINAYWYSALCIMAELSQKISQYSDSDMHQHTQEYQRLAELVKQSFLTKFWNEEEGCLKDVLSGTAEENQIRCNQIWTLSLPFTMLTPKMEEGILRKVKEELYTTIGLRTLSPKDPAFHDVYIGDMVSRDRAYHQGTVWAFPLGAYYRACIRFMKKKPQNSHVQMKSELAEGFQALEQWLLEGCMAQIAEIYDGKEPTVSRGCFAQAWSVGELLRAVYDWENADL